MLNIKSGTINTGQNTTSIVRYVDDKVYFLNANVAPLVSLMKKIGKSVKVTNPKFEAYEKSLGTFTTLFAGSNESTPGETITITTGDGAKFRENDLLFAPATSEQMIVTSISGDTLTVTRGYGTGTAANLSNGATLVFLGNAFMEATTYPEGQSLTSGSIYNYTQIFKDTIDLSRTELGTDRYDEQNPKLKDKRREMFVLHMEKINRQFWFGQKKEDTTGAKPKRATAGVLSFINTNRSDCGGSLTRAKMNTFLSSIFDYGVGNKYMFCGADFMNALDTLYFSSGSVQLTPKSKEFGLDIRTWISPYGSVSIVYDQVLSKVYSDYGVVIDFDTLKEYYMLKTVLKQNVQDPGYDGVVDQYITETGLLLLNEQKSGIVYNI